MPRDKNPSLAKTCLICRQKLINKLNINNDSKVCSVPSDDNSIDENNVKPEEVNLGDFSTTLPKASISTTSKISRWKALCLETFSMLFGLAANHPIISVFAKDRTRSDHGGVSGQMCNRCLQDVSNVHFIFWQLQSLERKLSELQALLFGRLRLNYENLPVATIFGRLGMEDLQRDLEVLKYDEIVKILFEEIKSKKDEWPKHMYVSRWQEACQNSEKIAGNLEEHLEDKKDDQITDDCSFSNVETEIIPIDHVKVEVDQIASHSIDVPSGAEDHDYYFGSDDQNDKRNASTQPVETMSDTAKAIVIPPDPPDLKKSSRSTLKRKPTKTVRFFDDWEEETSVCGSDASDGENVLKNEPLDSNEDDDDWRQEKKRGRGRPVKKQPAPKKIVKKIARIGRTKTKTTATTRFLCTDDPDNCTSTFQSKTLLKKHVRSVHHVAKKFSCEECSAKFKSETSLESHIEKVHNNSNKDKLRSMEKEICETCGIELEHKDMRKHFFLRHHGRGNFKCERCTMDFHSVADYEAHEQLHASAKFPFSCVVVGCEKLFTNSMDLKGHVTSNHLSSGLKCEICGIMKPNEYLLQRHMKIHDRVKKFVCNGCGKSFATKGYLKYHEEHFHTNVGRKFPCEVCGKEFLHEKNVMRHLITHQEEKPFKCKICPKTFNYSHLLKKHEEIHSGTKNYECHLCGKRWRQEQNLRQHMKSHRPKPEKLGVRKRSVKSEEEMVEEISYEIREEEVLEGEEEEDGEMMMEVRDDDDNTDTTTIPVILQVKGDMGVVGGVNSEHHHHMILNQNEIGGGGGGGTILHPIISTSSPPPTGVGGENVIEATIIPAAQITTEEMVEVEDENGQRTMQQYETVQEIQLHTHHSQDMSQGQQTATVVFLYEYQA